MPTRGEMQEMRRADGLAVLRDMYRAGDIDRDYAVEYGLDAEKLDAIDAER